MSDQTVLMTEAVFRKVQDELDQLLNITRPTIIAYLQDARDGIDAADNTEFLYLQEELIFVERYIRELQFSLENAQIIQPLTQAGVIKLGSQVDLIEEGRVLEQYTIIGATEADPGVGFISHESPLGQALLGHAAGDEIAVETSEGVLYFRIISVK